MIAKLSAVLAFVAFAASCDGGSTNETKKGSKVTDASNSSQTETYCMGRLILQVPVDFNLVAGEAQISGSSFEVVGTGSKADFDQLIEGRRGQIRSMPAPAGLPNALFADVRHASGHVFGFTSDTTAYKVGGGDLEIYAHSANTIFRAKRSALQENGALQFLEEDFFLIENIKPRGPSEIPSGPAFCFEGGYINSARVEAEMVTFTFGKMELESTKFSGTVDTGNAVQKFQKPFSTPPASVTVNDRTILGLPGQEAFSFLTKARDGEDGFFFNGRTPVKDIRAGSPKARIEYKQWERPTGQAYEPSDIKAIWDGILDSMRFTNGTLR